MNKIIAKALEGIREINDNYRDNAQEGNEKTWLSIFKDYHSKLWDIQITFDLYEQRKIKNFFLSESLVSR